MSSSTASAAAILIDATLVCGVLLPATMKLLGERNWYLPAWLQWLPHFDAEEPPIAPEAMPVPRIGVARARVPAADETRPGPDARLWAVRSSARDTEYTGGS